MAKSLPEADDAAEELWSHAREVEATVDARVEFISGLMIALLWERGKSAKKLSAIWDIPLSTVQNYSAEASRHVTGDADEARRDITVGARKLLRQTVDSGDALGFKQVADIWATVSGAKAAEKLQVSGVGLDDLDEVRKAALLNECPETNKDDEPNS